MSSVRTQTRAEMLDVIATTLLGRTSRLTRQLMSAGSRELTRTEAGALTTLVDGPRRISELAKSEALAQPSVTKLVDKLEARGLVVRERDDADNRAVVVALSAAGRRSLEAVRRQVRSELRRTLSGLGDDDLAVLVAAGDVLDRVTRALHAEIE